MRPNITFDNFVMNQHQLAMYHALCNEDVTLVKSGTRQLGETTLLMYYAHLKCLSGQSDIIFIVEQYDFCNLFLKFVNNFDLFSSITKNKIVYKNDRFIEFVSRRKNNSLHSFFLGKKYEHDVEVIDDRCMPDKDLSALILCLTENSKIKFQ